MKKVRTTWNLTSLYRGPRDPRIEKDARFIERAYETFEKKYRGKKNYLKNKQSLKKALMDYEALVKKVDSVKPLMYFHLLRELNGDNRLAQARVRQLEDRFTKSSNRIQFFELALGTIPAREQKTFLSSPTLSRYRRFLERIFETAKYDLTEPEENILSLKSAPAQSMWVSGVDTAINKIEIRHNGKNIPINEALGKVSETKNVRARRALWEEITSALLTISDFAQSEMNAIYTDKKINDTLRGFRAPYAATILGYENEEKSVLSLVDTVTKNFTASRRFFEMKRRLLGLPYLSYADRNVSIGKTEKRYSFTNAVDIVHDVFKKADKRYAEILDSYLLHGQIDVYPKKGKSGGAYCLSTIGLPTRVLLNHVPTFRSVSTLAHEMGHAIHAERSKTQPVLYEGHSIAVAETASTFFEGLVFERIKKELSKEEQVIALHDKIQDDISTIHRQIAFFNYERELHERVRADGWVSKEEMAKMLNTHMAAYLGPAVKMAERDGYFFTMVGHFRRPFYVYTYAYGQLISKALLRRYMEDPTYIQKIDAFLSAGASKKPEDIFADIGIVVGPELFSEGLKSIEQDIRELGRLTK